MSQSQPYPSHGQGFPTHLPNPSRPHFTAGGLPNPSYSTLPPLPAAAMEQPRLPQTQLQSSASPYSQPAPAPVYAPTANLPSDSSITSAPQRPSYTLNAPSNIQLPKIQPAPPSRDLRMAPDQRKENLHSLASAPLPPPAELSPKHVVGSQGRRGILPSASGRPPAVSSPSANGDKNSQLQKDADGKYPCPHCNKPYLHAKHLKRHMLRHTGVRPYECALCHDTFSRSDILKRHFQKCSVRRGNPTGENHLAYSRANKKKQQQEKEDFLAMTAEQVTLPTYSTSIDSPIGLASMESLTHSGFDRQEPLANQVTRSNEMRKVMASSNRGSASSLNFEALSTGHVTPDSVTTSGAATPYTFPHERSALNSPADTNFNPMVNMHRYSNGLHGGSLPHIVGRGPHDFDWNFSEYSPHGDFNTATYHSGSSTPHHSYKQPDADLSNFDWTTLQQHK